MQNDIGPLLHRVASELDQVSNHILEKRLKIGLSQFRILLVLEVNDGIRQNQIAGELDQTEAAISRQVKLLDRLGLARVLKSPSNRREKNVFITEKGREISNSARELLNEYHAPLFAELSEKEQWQILSSLQKISRYLNSF